MALADRGSPEEGPDGYKHFDDRDDDWTKVILHP
jgi:hypothetical protein